MILAPGRDEADVQNRQRFNRPRGWRRRSIEDGQRSSVVGGSRRGVHHHLLFHIITCSDTSRTEQILSSAHYHIHMHIIDISAIRSSPRAPRRLENRLIRLAILKLISFTIHNHFQSDASHGIAGAFYNEGSALFCSLRFSLSSALILSTSD